MPSYSIRQEATREYFFEHDEENENIKRMAIDNSRNLFVSNGVETQKFIAGHGHGFPQFDFDLDQPTTCFDCAYIGEIYFGLHDGNVAVCRLGRVEEIITFPFNTPVTAIYCKPSATVGSCYVAHGQHVSLIRISGSERTILPSQHTVEGDNPITLLRSYNNVLYCFARNRIFLYNEQTGQQNSIGNYYSSGNQSVLSVFMHPEQNTVHMVYPYGIYAIYDNDPNTFREINAYAYTIMSACHFGDFFAVCNSQDSIYVYRFTDTHFTRVVYLSLATLNFINIGVAHLCAPREGNEFNLITRNWLIRFSIEEGDSSSEEESEHFSDEDSESSDSSESEGEEEPAHDASGGGPAVGSKRRQPLDKDDPAFERKRKVMLQRALQFLTEEERQVILNAPQELLNEIREEECAVCMQPLNREGVRAITSECDHVMCEPCERIVVRRDPRCPTCREPWQRATLEMLLLV